MNKHKLQCPKCYNFRILSIEGVRLDKDNKSVGIKIPFFICPSCEDKEPLKPKEYYNKLLNEKIEEIEEGELLEIKCKCENVKFEGVNNLGFIYSSIDYFLIPGLYREWNEGFLCPVFFDKDVLLYYNNHPDYSVKLDSFSSGNIYIKDRKLFKWGFGINRNGKLFKWLGDLSEDFKSANMKSHLNRFIASNIESDHDIYSKFYLSQNPFSIEDAFQESDNESKLFKIMEELNSLFQSIFEIRLTQINIQELSDYYRPPILEEREQIFNAYSSLNKYLIENIQTSILKEELGKKGIFSKAIKSLGSLKTFQKFLESVEGIYDIDNIISPLYVLSDLRQLQGHLSNTTSLTKYSFCKKRLGLEDSVGDFEVYSTLISKLNEFYEILVTKIKVGKNGS